MIYLATLEGTDINGNPIHLQEFFKEFHSVAKSIGLELRSLSDGVWISEGQNVTVTVERWEK